MGEFNSDNHYIHYCGQESLRNWCSPHSPQTGLKCSTSVNLKNNRMILVHFQGKPFNITVIQVYAPTIDAEEADQLCEDLEYILQLMPKKRCSIHHWG